MDLTTIKILPTATGAHFPAVGALMNTVETKLDYIRIPGTFVMEKELAHG